jgi:hypothetical protein
MKNPLVDALRQASGAADASAPAAAAANPADDVRRPAIPSELALLDTLAIDAATGTANEELDADFYASASMQIAEGDEDMQIVPLGLTEFARSRALARKSGGSGLPRLGRFSPILCIALFLLTSAFYFIGQFLAGRNENADLLMLSTHLDAAGNEVAPVATGRFVNPLQLIRQDEAPEKVRGDQP